MGLFVYTEATNQFARGNIDLSGGDDIRVLLITTGSTAAVDGPTGRDAPTLAAMTGLNEYTQASYARQALTELVIKSDVNNWSVFDAADATFLGLQADDGGRQAIGLIVYKHVGADSVNIPICHIDSGLHFPWTGNGSDVTIRWSGNGIMLIRNA